MVEQNNNNRTRQLKQSLNLVFQVDCLTAMIYHIAAKKMVKDRVLFLRRNEKFERSASNKRASESKLKKNGEVGEKV